MLQKKDSRFNINWSGHNLPRSRKVKAHAEAQKFYSESIICFNSDIGLKDLHWPLELRHRNFKSDDISCNTRVVPDAFALRVDMANTYY